MICIQMACRVLQDTGAQRGAVPYRLSLGRHGIMIYLPDHCAHFADLRAPACRAVWKCVIRLLSPPALRPGAYQQPLPHRTLYQDRAGGCCMWWLFAILRDSAGRPSPRQGAGRCSTASPALSPSGAGACTTMVLKYPWQSLFYTMTGMGVMIAVLSVFIP